MENVKVGSKVKVVNLENSGIVDQKNLIGSIGEVVGIHDDLDLQLDIKFENSVGGYWFLSYDNVELKEEN